MSRLKKLITKNDGIFRGQAEEYIFILLNTHGGLICGQMGVSNKLYYSKKLATKWRDKIYDVLAHSNHPLKDKAIIALDGNYEYILKIGNL